MGRRPSAVATLVQRSSRYLRLVALPHGIEAVPVRIALVDDLNHIEDGMCKTLTWDRGREMADHVKLTEGPVARCTSAMHAAPGGGARMRI